MTTDLVPAENLAALEAMEPATREVAVTHMLSEARQWLAHAVETTGPQQIAEFKAFVATVEESTRQLNLSKAIQLDATEMVRRAERGIGVAIRRGQDAGEFARRGDIGGRGAPGHVGAVPGSSANDHLASPKQFFTNSQALSESYAMTDGVSDEQFDAAITEAKSEGNLARANVVRKVRGEAPVSSSQRPEVLRRTRRLDSNRIVEQTVLAVEGIGALLDQVDYTELDRRPLNQWVIDAPEPHPTYLVEHTGASREARRHGLMVMVGGKPQLLMQTRLVPGWRQHKVVNSPAARSGGRKARTAERRAARKAAR